MKKVCIATSLALLYIFMFYPAFSAPAAASINSAPMTDYIFQDGRDSNNYSIKILPAPAQTYGYEIYLGEKLIVRQLNIPGLPGVKGFKRKSDAKKVAELVTQKLSKGIMPPTIEKKEMERLNVQF